MKLIKITQHGFYKGIEDTKYVVFEEFDKKYLTKILHHFSPSTCITDCEKFVQEFIDNEWYLNRRLQSGLGEVEMETIDEDLVIHMNDFIIHFNSKKYVNFK